MGTGRRRNRVLAAVVGAGLPAGAVLVLRVDGESGQHIPPDRAERHRVQRYHTDFVVLPEPGARPDPPRDLTATPAAGRLRLAWADGLPGGPAPRGAVGYEVRLGERTRLTAAPVTEFDGLPDGVAMPASVRSVDAFGRRSDPIGLPGVVHESWRDGLTGALEEFPDGTRAGWHLSGHPGCVDVGTRAPGERGLPVDVGCGADEAVLSTRAPMTLDGGTGRFTVLTDAAGPGGILTIDLAPGRADRIGTRDPASVPPPVLRVVADDAGVRIGTAPPARRAPRRGAGVAHRFEVRLSPQGVEVAQDGLTVATSSTPVPWTRAYPLVGVRGPDGRRSRVHVTAIGHTGPATPVPTSDEVQVVPATRRVLGPAEQAPGSGISRTPLTRATTARVVATLTADTGLDPGAITIQLGQADLPATPTIPGPFTPGSSITVTADLPTTLLGDNGAPTLSPLVVRAPGATGQTLVQEMYLELDQAPPGWAAPPRTSTRRPTIPALPRTTLTLGNAAGRDLPGATPKSPEADSPPPTSTRPPPNGTPAPRRAWNCSSTAG
ncbi:hypothetical protein UO65_4762 [Actinokineospora spheciospongiae]|uniref:Uncharacterized protein n=1 Tax=Actinokineospora spheciospongiae TaxID=909613 RepID=W7IT20_9PSEU|nr:hypothetical protein [Actinokineospora spheciospongiae]EWC59902.1 hypothetical protein UO65_4762 [Actinokineospora spheciospongiae]